MLSTLCPLYVSRSVTLSTSTQFPSVHFIILYLAFCLTNVPHYIGVMFTHTHTHTHTYTHVRTHADNEGTPVLKKRGEEEEGGREK